MPFEQELEQEQDSSRTSFLVAWDNEKRLTKHRRDPFAAKPGFEKLTLKSRSVNGDWDTSKSNGRTRGTIWLLCSWTWLPHSVLKIAVIFGRVKVLREIKLFENFYACGDNMKQLRNAILNFILTSILSRKSRRPFVQEKEVTCLANLLRAAISYMFSSSNGRRLYNRIQPQNARNSWP